MRSVALKLYTTVKAGGQIELFGSHLVCHSHLNEPPYGYRNLHQRLHRKTRACSAECSSLISPQFVTPFVKPNKNDRNEAEGICEAVGRPNMRFDADARRLAAAFCRAIPDTENSHE